MTEDRFKLISQLGAFREELVRRGFSVNELDPDDSGLALRLDSAPSFALGWRGFVPGKPDNGAYWDVRWPPRVEHRRLYDGRAHFKITYRQGSSARETYVLDVSKFAGRFAEVCYEYYKDLIRTRAAAKRELLLRDRMAAKIPADEAAWSRRPTFGWLPSETSSLWQIETPHGGLTNIPEAEVLSLQDHLDQVYATCESRDMPERKDWLTRIAWSRHVMSLPLPPRPNIPKRFRSLKKQLDEIALWNP